MKVFEAEHADAIEQKVKGLKRQGQGGGRPAKPLRTALIDAIKAEGVDHYVDRRLAEYKAHLKRLRTRLAEQGVTYKTMDPDTVRTVKEEWHL